MKLSTLDLSFTAVTDSALTDLQNLSALTTLYLTHTKMTDQHLDRLCSLTSLVGLGLERNKNSRRWIGPTRVSARSANALVGPFISYRRATGVSRIVAGASATEFGKHEDYRCRSGETQAVQCAARVAPRGLQRLGVNNQRVDPLVS